MKLGAQLFSLRKFIKTPEDIRTTFEKVKAMGFDNVQFSGGGPIEAHELKAISEDTGLPIVCTHSAPDRILNDTEALIEEHKIFGCPVIGYGCMPKEFRKGERDVMEFFEELKTPVEKILNSGLRFAYHNHAFEFEDIGGIHTYDLLIEEFPELNFILDTYWVKYGGYDYLSYIEKIGNARMTNVHFKDMKDEPRGKIVPCGTGVIDFAPVVKLCDKLGIPNALVEQDTAPKTGDSYGQMRISYNNLKKLF